MSKRIALIVGHPGYRKRTELEPDLIKSQETLKWAEHIVGGGACDNERFFGQSICPDLRSKKEKVRYGGANISPEKPQD